MGRHSYERAAEGLAEGEATLLSAGVVAAALPVWMRGRARRDCLGPISQAPASETFTVPCGACHQGSEEIAAPLPAMPAMHSNPKETSTLTRPLPVAHWTAERARTERGAGLPRPREEPLSAGFDDPDG